MKDRNSKGTETELNNKSKTGPSKITKENSLSLRIVHVDKSLTGY